MPVGWYIIIGKNCTRRWMIMIKTVVFDIGRVLIGFEWFPYLHELYDGRYEDPDRLVEKVTEATFHSSRWSSLDRGLLDGERIMQQCVAAAPDIAVPIREAFENVGKCTERTDYAIPWIKELKDEGFQVLYLSNYSKYVSTRSSHALDFIPYMDGGVFSCDVNWIKPEREIFNILLKKYNLKAEECVFLDDNKNNIEAASAMGFNTIPFEYYQQAHGELMSLLDAFNRTNREQENR